MTKDMLRTIVVPIIAFAVFLGIWSIAAVRIETSLGTVPGPLQVLRQAQTLVVEYQQERTKARIFYQKQKEEYAQKLAMDPGPMSGSAGTPASPRI